MDDFWKRMYNVSKGIESLSKEEHGLFFDAVQRLELPGEVKQAAVAFYLDFKNRPIGEYNAGRKNLRIFLIASVSLAAKATGHLRTDQEFESKMSLTRERLIDAEERILRSLGIQDAVVSVSELSSRLTQRQVESMADGFAERGLINAEEKDSLVNRSCDYLDVAVDKGLSPKMSYRGRAAGVVLNVVKDLGLQVSEREIAIAAGLSKSSIEIDAKIIEALLNGSKGPERKERREMSG